MGARKPEITEPIVVDKFSPNRGTEAITTTFQSYKGHNLVDLRKYVLNRQGISVPTGKGITLKVAKLPDLLKAINKAVKKAKELGLIDEAE